KLKQDLCAANEFLQMNALGTALTCASLPAEAGDIESITAGVGLSGGGGSGDVTLDLDIDELPLEASIASGDYIPLYDVSASALRKMTRDNLLNGVELSTNRGAASGYASLNASSQVEQLPASAQTTPGAGKIPLTGAGTTIDKDWYPTMQGDSGSGG